MGKRDRIRARFGGPSHENLLLSKGPSASVRASTEKTDFIGRGYSVKRLQISLVVDPFEFIGADRGATVRRGA